MSNSLDELANRAQHLIDVLRNRPDKELDLLMILELGEGALKDPEAENIEEPLAEKTIAPTKQSPSDEIRISDESDDATTVIMASSTPRIFKSSPTSSGDTETTSQSIKATPTSSGESGINSTSSETVPMPSTTSGEARINSTSSTPPKILSTRIVKSSPTSSGKTKATPASSKEPRINLTSSTTPKTSRNSIRFVKSSPTTSQSIKAAPATSGGSGINSTPSNPIKTEPTTPKAPESSRKRAEVVVVPSPAVKKRRSTPKADRHPYLGIDHEKMWEFVIDTMNWEIDNNVNHSAKNLAKGIDIWDEFYDKYDDPTAEYENMHSPYSLQSHFMRVLFENLPTCEYMGADTKLKWLKHSKYKISEDFRRQLQKDTKSRIICDKKGVIVKVQHNIVILESSDESEDEEDLPETDPME
ncbi:hypothetical protein L5515_002728 [Caenorhabditis briggsae]|uniref:Uncharacterized protein n=1 Tax=Caenorhabditis briggsae TaxID=6238 RepID=A0AAE9E781_CAEBR|nr:hypothetical protein L5515_002728 [Caenorhabditis briggsae]